VSNSASTLSNAKVLWIFGLAALSMSLVSSSALEYLPYTAEYDAGETIEKFNKIFLWTFGAGWIGTLIVGLYGDRHVRGHPLFLAALAPSLIAAAIFFGISALFVPHAPYASYISLPAYSILFGVAEIALYASAACVGRTPAERLQILLLVQLATSMGYLLSGPLSLSSVGGDISIYWLVFGLPALALVAAFPSKVVTTWDAPELESQSNSQNVREQVGFSKDLARTIGLVFLFSCASSASLLFLPTSPSEGQKMTLYAFAVALAALPLTWLLVRRVGRNRLTSQQLLVGATCIIFASYIAKLFASTSMFREIELISSAVGGALYIFVAAALLATLSDLAHIRRMFNKPTHFAKYMLIYFLSLTAGSIVGRLLLSGAFSFENKEALSAASLSVILWGLFLIAAISGPKTNNGALTKVSNPHNPH
jgi:hypothetical protein